MSYSDFSADTLRRQFGVTFRQTGLFESVGSLAPSSWLKESLAKAHELALISEKARSEFLVAPMLVACRDLFDRKVQIFSGARLDVDPARGLTGECDFILARAPSSHVLQTPLFVILEAKKNDIEEGLTQCAAQLVGAELFNQRDDNPTSQVFGCVTTGETWQFLKLHQNAVLIDSERYFINEPGKILWILVTILKSFPEKQTGEAA